MLKRTKKRHSLPNAVPEIKGGEGADKEKPNKNPENKQHKEDFERLLDDASMGVPAAGYNPRHGRQRKG